MSRFVTAVLAAVIALCPVVRANAHGGGGGGGHGGGGSHTYVYTYYYGGGGGVAAVPDAINGDTSKVHTVAIVTTVGQNLVVGDPGWFQQRTRFDISELGLDDFIATTAKQYLGTRFTFVDLPYDRAKLALVSNGANDPATTNYSTYLQGVPTDGIDAFMIIRPDAESAGAIMPGLSVGGGDGSRPVLHANYEIDIVDAKTGQRISHVLSRIQFREGAGASFAAIFGPPSLLLTSKDTPSLAQRTTIKEVYQQLLGKSLIETIRPLNLGAALPAASARAMVPNPDATRPKLSAVALVSAVGDTLELEHRAAFFVHDSGSQPIGDWHFDGDIEALMTAALDKRISVKQAAGIDRARIAAQTFTPSPNPPHVPVDGLVRTDAVQAYLVVVRTTTPDIFGDQIAGLGMMHHTALVSDDTTAFTSLALAVVDAKTLLPVVVVRLTASLARPQALLAQLVPNVFWPEKMTYAPGQSEMLHHAFDDTVADAIPETLMRLRLTAMIPATDQLPPSPDQAATVAP
jgi:hypothetical protein